MDPISQMMDLFRMEAERKRSLYHSNTTTTTTTTITSSEEYEQHRPSKLAKLMEMNCEPDNYNYNYDVHIPAELWNMIIDYVFPLYPPACYYRLSFVCKQWNQLIERKWKEVKFFGEWII